MRGWVGLALFAAGCSQSADERGPAAGAISAAKKLGHAMPSASISARLRVIHPLRLKLELRAEALPSGGQRVVASVPELGVEETLVEGAAPFVCQTTWRPMGGEPTVRSSEWLDVWCGPRSRKSIHFGAGVLTLGAKTVPIPGRRVSSKKMPELELEARRCESTGGQVDVRLVSGDHVIKLVVPKLGLSLNLQSIERGRRLDCKSSGSSDGDLMRLHCFHRVAWPSDRLAGVSTDDSFYVLSGVLIVDQTWHHFERSGHERWGIRLPCGRVKFHGL